jgi:hypothetical protein
VVSKNTIASPGSEIPMNDIADTSVRIQTSAEDRLFEKRARSEKFFSCPHAMLAISEQRSSCGAEQRRNAQSFVADTGTRDPEERAFRHRLSPITQQLIKECFS